MSRLTTLGFTALLALAAPLAQAAAVIGQPAPAFSLPDANGQTRSLADFKGKTVVLEWFNHECPFVKKHYGAGNLQRQQDVAEAQGVVWLLVNSSAAGKQGHIDGAQGQRILADWQATPTALLLDHKGDVGRAFGAKTTPQLVVIDAAGIVRYNGAIDSVPSADPADIPGATQYVEAALADLAAGRPVARPATPPYGCAIK